MVDDFQVRVVDVVRLMKDYLDRHIDVNHYCTTLFRLFTVRIEPHNEDTDRLLQEAYGDADDFDPRVRLQYTIQEPELRARVARSLAKLASLGHEVA